MSIPVVLSIAGSDCSAGAGLQADLKTFSALGCHGLTAATCVVAETPLEVRSIHPVPDEIFRDQLEILLESYPIAAIKTGLLCSPGQIVIVCDLLKGRDIPLVVDPVMVASTGDALQQENALTALKKLLSLASVITPNLPETGSILGTEIHSKEDQTAAAHELSKSYQTACYLKGGHLSNSPELRDLLVIDGQEEAFIAPFQNVPQTHGTGCTLAAAIATGLAKKNSISESCKTAHQFVQEAIRNSHRWLSPNSGEPIIHLDQS